MKEVVEQTGDCVNQEPPKDSRSYTLPRYDSAAVKALVFDVPDHSYFFLPLRQLSIACVTQNLRISTKRLPHSILSGDVVCAGSLLSQIKIVWKSGLNSKSPHETRYCGSGEPRESEINTFGSFVQRGYNRWCPSIFANPITLVLVECRTAIYISSRVRARTIPYSMILTWRQIGIYIH